MPFPKKNTNNKEDLKSVTNPQGRLEVLGYKLGEKFFKELEQQKGISGLWDTLEPHVQTVAKGMSGWSIPAEASLLFSIIQLGMSEDAKQAESQTQSQTQNQLPLVSLVSPMAKLQPPNPNPQSRVVKG